MLRFRLAALSFLICFVLLAVPVSAQNRYYVPHAAAGFSGDLRFVTQISILNTRDTGDPAADVKVSFYTDDGDPWQVAVSCPEQSSLDRAAAVVEFQMALGAKYLIRMGPSGQLNVGWVEVESENPLQVAATYGFYQKMGSVDFVPFWEAAVLPSPTATTSSFPAHKMPSDVAAGVDVNTAFAVANPNAVAAAVTAILVNHAHVVLDMKNFTVPAHGHKAQFMDELFSTFPATGVRATVRLLSNVPIAALAMKEAKGPTRGVYSTLPVDQYSDFTVNSDYDLEPNSTIGDAQLIFAPVEINGTVNEQGGQYVDYFKISLTTGQRLEAILLAGALGSSLNPTLQIRNTTSGLGSFEELFTGAHDLRATYTAAGNGVYYIKVGAANGTQGRDAFYRLLVRVFPPDASSLN